MRAQFWNSRFYNWSYLRAWLINENFYIELASPNMKGSI